MGIPPQKVGDSRADSGPTGGRNGGNDLTVHGSPPSCWCGFACRIRPNSVLLTEGAHRCLIPVELVLSAVH